jgi:hypothetical protein
MLIDQAKPYSLKKLLSLSTEQLFWFKQAELTYGIELGESQEPVTYEPQEPVAVPCTNQTVEFRVTRQHSRPGLT